VRLELTFVALQDPILSERIALSANQSMDRISPQVIMIVEIFVSEHQPMNALTDHFLHAMFDVALVTFKW